MKHCIDCGIKISNVSTRCRSCAMKYLFKNPENNPNWRGGEIKKIYCIECGVLLGKYAYYNKSKRCKSCSKKGENHNFFGKKHSLETIKKMSINRSGEKNHMYGKIRSAKVKETISRKLKVLYKDKNNHPSWRGGKSFESYDEKFNNKYKETIRHRDDNICQLCGKTHIENGRELDVHHIDYDKMNTKPSNNIALCNSCNSKVNFNRKYWTKYFNKMIKEKYNNADIDMLCRV